MAGAAARPFGFGASGLVVGSATLLVGWSVRETSGAAGAVVEIRDGSAAGELVGASSLPAGTSDTVWAGDRGVGVQGGLFVVLVSGAVSGALWAIPVERVGDGSEVPVADWWNFQDGVRL